jgi:DNA processing protein
VDAPLSQMPLQILSEGAHMARGAQDIVSSLNWITPVMQLSFDWEARQAGAEVDLSGDEAAIVRCVENEALSFDEIKEITHFEADRLNSLLTILEIKEIMKQLPGKMYTLVR